MHHESLLWAEIFAFMKYIYISIGIIVTIVLGALSLWRPISHGPALSVAATTSPQIQIISPSEVTPNSRTTTTQKNRSNTVSNIATSTAPESSAQAPNITLSIEGHPYSVFVPADSTVLDAMRALTSTSGFTFTGREYTSLGFFVDSINEKKSEKSHNWILYVNGKLSNTGASQTALKAGDTVEWKYEKSY